MRKKTSWWLSIIVTVIYMQTLYYKFTAHPDSVYIFRHLDLEPYGRVGLGLTELLVSIGIWVPRTRTLAFLVSLGIISGAIIAHLFILGIQVQGDGGRLFILAVIVWLSSFLWLLLHRKSLKSVLHI